ncbi:hypothetical protein BDR04DRAFT_1158868 [Suillus decipiens]|nr:hypothetical protein BDR04DRAFT_1158868 [Suillus decipiens]
MTDADALPGFFLALLCGPPWPFMAPPWPSSLVFLPVLHGPSLALPGSSLVHPSPSLAFLLPGPPGPSLAPPWPFSSLASLALLLPGPLGPPSHWPSSSLAFYGSSLVLPDLSLLFFSSH